MDHTFDDGYWDRVWEGGPGHAMATSPPNPHLVEEVGDLTPGTALDAGCGAGAEVIWLAARGWRVTGADLTAAALDRAAARAAEAGVADRVEWVRADLSTWAPEGTYDLVTTHYAHPAMPQLEFYDRVASWVAPGGTLLVVGHLHQEGGGHGHGGHGPTADAPPASASVTAATITARLDPERWTVGTAREVRRAAGPGGGSTVDDVVVRAVRRP